MHHFLIYYSVLGSYRLACKGFTCKSKAIHEVGVEGEELHEQSVDSQLRVTLFCSSRDEEEMYGYEAESAEEDVLVHIEERENRLSVPDGFCRDKILLETGDVVPFQQIKSREKSSPLSYNCAESHTFDFHSQSKHETKTGDDVRDVLTDGYCHRSLRVLHSDVPSVEGEESERSRSSEDTYIKIGTSERSHICRWGDEPQSSLADERRDENEENGDADCDAKTAGEQTHHFMKISASPCLSSHATCAHAEEGEHPIDDVEQHSAHSNSTDVCLRTKMSGDGYVDESKQRNGDIAHDAWKGNEEYLTVASC